MTETTKKYRRNYRLASLASIIILGGPILYYMLKSIKIGTATQVFALSGSIIVALMLLGANIMFKLKLRCIIWILLLGIFICLRNITNVLVILAIGSVIDELLLTPFSKNQKNKYIINKEIDKRG